MHRVSTIAIMIGVLLVATVAPVWGINRQQTSPCKPLVTGEATPTDTAGDITSITDDGAFLDEIAKDTYTYLTSEWATENHLPYSWRSATLSGGDYVNVTEIGFLITTHIAAYEMQRSWSPSLDCAVSEVNAILDQLLAWQTNDKNSYQGVFYQWYWLNPQPRVGASDGDHAVPSIDNAWLALSLLAARSWANSGSQIDPAIAQKAERIVSKLDFMLWYDHSTHLFWLGDKFNPQGTYKADYLGNENRIINFVAHTLGQLNAQELQASLKALVQKPQSFRNLTVAAAPYDGSYFTLAGPALFIDEMNTSFGWDTIEPATAAQFVFAQQKGYPATGFSDCFATGDGGYVQSGAPPATAPREDYPGLITPHASAMMLITSHDKAAVANLRHLAAYPGLYDPQYGFRDSIMLQPGDPQFGAVSARFSALAQQFTFLAIANHQTGVIWRLLYADPGVKTAHQEMYGAPPPNRR